MEYSKITIINWFYIFCLSSISAILSGTIGIHYGHVLIHFKVTKASNPTHDCTPDLNLNLKNVDSHAGSL